MPTNRLCKLLGIKYPIIQAGMVWVSDWRLASAASNAGALGTVGTGAMTPEQVRENIEMMNKHTDKPYAVNIPMIRPDAAEIGAIAYDMGARIFISSAGNPAKIVPLLKKPGVTLLHVVPSVKGAKKAEREGVDAVVCEGYEAGGHNSPLEITTLALVPQVVDAINVPVVAAGGIADGRGIAAVMALGADGAQLGTRFIATEECQAHPNYKKLIVESADLDTCIIGRKLDMLRVLRTDFARKMEEAEKAGATKEELLKIIGSEFNRNRIASWDGDLEQGTFQSGQSAGLISEILPVKELVHKLVAEYEYARNSLQSL